VNKPKGDVMDHPASGRFVRNVALSLSGGALLALLGAGAAHAQDASTSSAGLGATGTGDATALGNHSGSNTTQGGTISGAQGSVQVITQTGTTNNNGVAVANTGGNTATGNSSTNTSTATQAGVGGAGGAVNNGQAANSSDGIAFVTTGNASAVGNESTTNLNQTISARGALGGILVLTQDSTVTNTGRAFAGTGGNDATGNDSSNTSTLGSTFDILNGLGSNSGKATTSSNGDASIATGNASAMGNVSDTSVTQSSNGAAGGDGGPGGLVLIPQTADVTNDGRARATTGGNTADGNDSGSETTVTQNIGGAGNVGAPQFDTTGVASNAGSASTWSNGSASVRTGDASAVGNDSHSNISQWATSDLTADGGLTVLPQSASIDNTGRARARTGGNTAIGNEAGRNLTSLVQNVNNPGTGTIDLGVISNSADVSNRSDGNATIDTGDASAAGNRSRSDLSQRSTANNNNLNIYPQVATIQNTGRARAATGGNEAVGNDSAEQNTPTQTVVTGVGIDGPVIASNSARVTSDSDGSASIATGSASAVGNHSASSISQEIDPVGLVLPVQAAAIVNTGTATALTGGNTAFGNESGSRLTAGQTASLENSPTLDVNVGLQVASNQLDATNASDGTASISPGSAWALGNASDSSIGQSSTGEVDGLGLIVNTQAAAVLNAGAARATTGGNDATGNSTFETVDSAIQTASIGSGDAVGTTEVDAGIATASNALSASNASDGTATIETGSARATGNRSATRIGQVEDATVSGLGAVINTQAAVVANAGLGVATTGGNSATGSLSPGLNGGNVASLTQRAAVGSDNAGATTVAAPVITAANSASVGNATDGTADISTGSADATGNASSTDITQDPASEVSGLGLVVNTQVAGVANLGLGVANTGGNTAIGNESDNAGNDATPAAFATQNALIGTGNLGGGTTDVTAFGPMTAANQAEVGNESDGTARIRTGAAQAQGNVSTTSINQAEDGTVSGLGVVINTQAAGVANIGVGVANTGLNLAIGNESDNGGGGAIGANVGPGADLTQNALIGATNTGGTTDITSFGPMTANNAGRAENSSDGTAQVGTGNALATGNTSATTISQHQSSEVRDMGVDVSTQVGGVANVGAAVANSGLNLAIGNASGQISPTFGPGTPNTATATQTAAFESALPDPAEPVTVVGPLTAANEGEATNSSDGTACVCTGNAVASGNISTTNLVQDLDTSVGTGAIVLTEAGGVLNAGLAIANTGLNAAFGNISQNLATASQANTVTTGIGDGDIVGPQTVHSGGGASNASNGTGKVGTGNATATGNLSTTNFVQAAAADSNLAVATLASGTSNTGLGLANSGLNLGVGNASTNTATLTQTADGAGIVSSVGTASNVSDGQGLVGNPDCLVPGAPGTPTPTTPGTSSLPKTGAPVEVEAAIGLMLLLAGFGLRRKSASLA
jgi:hypothetical protein